MKLVNQSYILSFAAATLQIEGFIREKARFNGTCLISLHLFKILFSTGDHSAIGRAIDARNPKVFLFDELII